MDKSKKDLSGLLDLLGEDGLQAPKVEAIVPDVRSGVTFSFVDAGEFPDSFVRRVVLIWGYDVTEDRAQDFHDWLSAVEEQLSAKVQEISGGKVIYRGTYGVSIGDEIGSGRYRTIWGLETLEGIAALNKLIAAPEDASLQEIFDQFFSFRDRDSAQTAEILVAAAGAKRL